MEEYLVDYVGQLCGCTPPRGFNVSCDSISDRISKAKELTDGIKDILNQSANASFRKITIQT